jgi:hypothetical protein
MKLLQREMYVAKERAEREERRKRARGRVEKKEKEDKDEEEDALVFDPLDVASVMAKAGFVCACLDTIRADGEDYCTWEQRAEASVQRARCRTLGLTQTSSSSEESSEESPSESSNDDDE